MSGEIQACGGVTYHLEYSWLEINLYAVFLSVQYDNSFFICVGNLFYNDDSQAIQDLLYVSNTFSMFSYSISNIILNSLCLPLVYICLQHWMAEIRTVWVIWPTSNKSAWAMHSPWALNGTANNQFASVIHNTL